MCVCLFFCVLYWKQNNNSPKKNSCPKTIMIGSYISHMCDCMCYPSFPSLALIWISRGHSIVCRSLVVCTWYMDEWLRQCVYINECNESCDASHRVRRRRWLYTFISYGVSSSSLSRRMHGMHAMYIYIYIVTAVWLIVCDLRVLYSADESICFV